jgi:hypothetical protein
MLVMLISVPVVMSVVLWYNNRRGLLTNPKHMSRYGMYIIFMHPIFDD